MPLDSRISLRVLANLTSTLDLGTNTAPLDLLREVVLANGTGLGQADKIFHDKRTIAGSGTDSLDLAGGLTDPFGAALTFVKLKALVVIADSANANNVNVTRPAANGVPLFLAAGDGIPVLPGGHFSWATPAAAGIAVTASTGDLIDIINSAGGTSVTYDVILLGTSA